MYQNIIFDLGGVVVDYAPREFLVDYFMNEKLEDQLFNITFGSEEWKQLDAGLISRHQAEAAMRKRGAELGHSFEVDAILNDWMDMLRTKDDTVQLMMRLKKRGYRLYYLSNIPSHVYDMLRQRRFFALFDGGLASCEVHLNKPDLRIYQALLKKYELDPTASIFIDDNKQNASAAFDMDMVGIHYKNGSALRKALKSYGVASEKKRGARANTAQKDTAQKS